uniref:Eyes absent homolog n=1 Tax=Paramormyrops kingsleyae TaxID=1676925 RepID=A0A3B3T5Y1_9TELE|nr:eyes absent homolog 3-like [Paramormyrops kingsleyae]
MDESQDVAQLPTKKARHDLDVVQEKEPRQVGVADDSSPPPGGDTNSYPPPPEPQLSKENSDPQATDTASENQVSSETLNSYRHSEVTCKGLTPTTTNDYTTQAYHGTKPYPQASTPTSSPAVTPFPTLTQQPAYSAFPPVAQGYGLPPFGSMWPGIKTETSLSEAPPVGQAGFLSFSTSYASSQPGQMHYSYPSQGSSFTTSSVYANIPAVTAPSTTSVTVAPQEFSTYSALGQSQFPQFYTPPPSYTPASLPSSGRDGESVAVTGYTGDKTEGTTAARLPNNTDSAVAVAPPAGDQEREEGGCRNSTGKAKGKGRKSENSHSTDSDLERVFLWDLDETIIIFHSLLTGSFAQKFGKDPTVVLNLGLQMEELIFELADTHLFFNDLEECDQVHVEDVASDDSGQDLSNYNFLADGFAGHGSGAGPGSGSVQGGVEWMRKLAFRYRRLREIYNSYKGNVGGLLSPMKRELLLRLQTDIERVTDAWMSTALKSLLLIQSRGRCMNVLVTTTQLVPALAKVLLYGLGEIFPIENIYSATKIGKESCFERIVSRFGKKVTYVVIGDGRDEELAAKQHNMPFWRISAHGDLISLYQALELDFL